MLFKDSGYTCAAVIHEEWKQCDDIIQGKWKYVAAVIHKQWKHLGRCFLVTVDARAYVLFNDSENTCVVVIQGQWINVNRRFSMTENTWADI